MKTIPRHAYAVLLINSAVNRLKGNCSGKKVVFLIPSIDRVCGSEAQEKKSDFLHGSVRRYKTLRSSTNCGCGHLMTHFVGIAITATVHSRRIYIARWGALLIVVPAPGAAVAPLQAAWTSG